MSLENLDQQIADARAQIADAQARITPLQEHLAYLLKVAAGPRVPVIGHFWHRYTGRTREFESFEDAVSTLDYMIDNASGSPVGVSVNGGEIIPFDVARERWGSRELADA